VQFYLKLSDDFIFRTRIYDPPDVPGLFEQHVWPEYVKYKNFLQHGNFPFLNIDATKSYDQVLQEIMKDLDIEFQTSE